mgnify:CR=1 FL=1
MVRIASVNGGVVVQIGEAEPVNIRTDQGVLDRVLPELDEQVAVTRRAWEAQRFIVPRFPNVASDPQINAGSPSIVGTRIETAMVASFGETDRSFTRATISELRACFPRVSEPALVDALAFEGLQAA